jgi:UDP-N-acetylmuramoyl-L-alanyl-D-glutamate--2,6-diaminopimelate ligase
VKRLWIRLRATRSQPWRVRRVLLHRELEPAQRVGEALLAIIWFRHPSRQLRLVGVTGTNGKTTTCQLIASILREAGHRTAVYSTLEGHASGSFTTPNPWALQRELRRMVNQETEWAVIEVSSHALTLRRVWGLRFDTVVVTNVTRDHLNFHHTMEAYVEAKARLFGGSPAVAVINAGDPWRERFERFAAGRHVLFGLHPDASVTARQMNRTDPGHISFMLDTPRGMAPVRLRAVGTFAVANALAAAAVASSLGIETETVARGLEACQPVPGRAEWITTGHGYDIVIDYAHNPDGLQVLFEALRPLTDSRLIAVFGVGGGRDRGKRPVMGQVAAHLCDVVVVTTDIARNADPKDLVAEIQRGIEDSGADPAPAILVEIERRTAIEAALTMAEPGDIVVISGLGPDPWPDGEGLYWTDRTVVDQFLAGAVADRRADDAS